MDPCIVRKEMNESGLAFARFMRRAMKEHPPTDAELSIIDLILDAIFVYKGTAASLRKTAGPGGNPDLFLRDVADDLRIMCGPPPGADDRLPAFDPSLRPDPAADGRS